MCEAVVSDEVVIVFLQAIQRFAQPGSDHLYTVVNKVAPGVSGKFSIGPQDPSLPAPREKEGRADPPYVNQPSFPPNPAGDKPIVYRKSPV